MELKEASVKNTNLKQNSFAKKKAEEEVFAIAKENSEGYRDNGKDPTKKVSNKLLRKLLIKIKLQEEYLLKDLRIKS